MNSKYGSKKKATSKVEGKAPQKMWVFIRVKYSQDLTKDKLAEKLVKDFENGRIGWMFADIPVKEGCAVFRADLAKSGKLHSVCSVEICAIARKLKKDGEALVDKKTGEPIVGWKIAWGKAEHLTLTERYLEKIRPRLKAVA